MEMIFENGDVFISGLLSEADVKNGNGRVYPWEIWFPAMKALQKRVLGNPQVIYSEREHPQRVEIDRNLACGLLTEITINETFKNARCRVKVLQDTQAGQQLLRDIKEGKKIGISTRGTGKLSIKKIVESIEFITGDIVSVPSCQVCYLSESVGEMVANDFILEYDEEKKLDNELKDIRIIQAFKRI